MTSDSCELTWLRHPSSCKCHKHSMIVSHPRQSSCGLCFLECILSMLDVRVLCDYLLLQSADCLRPIDLTISSPFEVMSSFTILCAFSNSGHARHRSSLLARPNSERDNYRNSSINSMLGPCSDVSLPCTTSPSSE